MHRIYYTSRHGAAAYGKRYKNPESGLIGDIEVGKGWHEHFTAPALVELLCACGLEPVRLDGAGFFARPLSLMRLCSPAPAKALLDKALEWDARHYESTHLFSTSLRP